MIRGFVFGVNGGGGITTETASSGTLAEIMRLIKTMTGVTQ